MKKTLFLSAVFAAASMFAADTAKTSTDVKEDFSSSIWSHWNTSKVKVKYSLNKEEGASAKGAAQISVLNSGSACFLKRFPVEPSSLYQADVMVKSAGKNIKANLAIQDFGMQKKFVKVVGKSVVAVSPEWQKISYFFRTSDKTETVQVLLDCNSPEAANILFDDFKMTKVEGLDEFYDSFAANVWGSWKSTKAKMKFGHDPVVGKKAPGSLKIDVLPGNETKKYSGCATFHLPVVPGKTYTVVVNVKTKDLDPDAKVSLSYQAQDEKQRFLGLPIPSRAYTAAECTDWKQIVITRKITNTGKWAKCRNFLVTLGASGSIKPGTVWFDDFEFFVEETDEE